MYLFKNDKLYASAILVKTTYKKRFEEKLDLDFNTKKSAKIALISSVDASLVGVYSSVLPVNIFFQIFGLFGVTYLMVNIALNVGYNHGASYQKVIGYTAGGIYLFLACLLLIIM